jgi:purine nucleoside phosphorylase
MGGHVVGMSMAPETILARSYGLKVFGLAAVVNWAAGLGPQISMDQILKNAALASKDLPQVLEPVLTSL